MGELSFVNLLIVVAAGFAAPLALGMIPGLRLPSVVLEIVIGIVIGPAVLGWVEIDQPVEVLALLGLAFLLLLAGLEIDLAALRGALLRAASLGFVISLGLALAAGLVLDLAGVADEPLLIAVILAATSLGVIVPVLQDAGESMTTFGQLVFARGLPALLYRGQLDRRRMIAAGLLQATSLPFIVAATQIGQNLGLIDAATSAGFIAAGLVTVLVFPLTALSLLRRTPPPRSSASRPVSGGRAPLREGRS